MISLVEKTLAQQMMPERSWRFKKSYWLGFTARNRIPLRSSALAGSALLPEGKRLVWRM